MVQSTKFVWSAAVLVAFLLLSAFTFTSAQRTTIQETKPTVRQPITAPADTSLRALINNSFKEPSTVAVDKIITLKQDVLRMDVCWADTRNVRKNAADANNQVWAWKLDVCANNAGDAYDKAYGIVKRANYPASLDIIANKIIKSKDCLERSSNGQLVKRTNYFVELIASCQPLR